MTSKPGTRIVAIHHIKDGTVCIFGYGVYEGDFEAPAKLLGIDRKHYENDCIALYGKIEPLPLHPRFKLDNGNEVWAGECLWYVTEEEMRTFYKGWAVVEISLAEERLKRRSLNNERNNERNP